MNALRKHAGAEGTAHRYGWLTVISQPQTLHGPFYVRAVHLLYMTTAFNAGGTNSN